ncbi:MAG: amidase, partial [Thermomicrobium sp.]
MTRDNLAHCSIGELAVLLRRRETSPVELAKLALQRLEQIGRRLNAVIALTAERAVDEARRVVAAGLVPFALGTKTWGSIIVPASSCGVTGLRPTYGRVSRFGAMTLSWTLDKIGPLVRTAEDCALVLAAVAGPDPRDLATIPQPWSDVLAPERRQGFRIGVLKSGLEFAQPEVVANFRAALAVLREFATLEPIALPDRPYGQVIRVVLSAEAASVFEELVISGATRILTAPEDRVGGIAGLTIPAVDYLRAQRICRQLRAELTPRLVLYDAIVAPSTLVVA